MRLIPPTAFAAATEFAYPRPMDGHARTLLEGEIDRLIFAANAEGKATVIKNTYRLSVYFENKANQHEFYRAFDRISDYMLDHVFTSADSPANKICHLKLIQR